MGVFVVAWLLACGGGEPPSALPGPPLPVGVAPDPLPEPPQQPQPPRKEARYAATEVIVAWSGAERAHPTVTRTEADAKQRAEALRARAIAGEDVSALAKEASDAPDAGRGGIVGTWTTGVMDPAFEDAVASVPIGGISPVARTAYGYAFARRDPVEQVHLHQLVVAWQGATPTQIRRTHDEAKARIAVAQARIAAGEDFEAVAREMSDDAFATVGGDIGLVARGQLVPAVEAAAFALSPGQTSAPIETPYGYELVRRDD